MDINKEKFDVGLQDHDDWLQKERIRESKISAWDFDEGKTIRKQHEENCDVKQLADEHHFAHLRSNVRPLPLQDKFPSEKKRETINWFYADLILMFITFPIMLIFSEFLDVRLIMLGPFILIAGTFLGEFFYYFAFKKTPPNSYFLALFIIFIILTVASVISSSSYIRFYLWRLMQ